MRRLSSGAGTARFAAPTVRAPGNTLRRQIILVVLLLAVLVAAIRVFVVARDFDNAVTAQHFATLRDDHPALRAFLYRMPKGADLHVHLSGAVYAEPMIGWAAREGLCVRLKDWFIVVPPCTPDEPPVAETMRDQRKFDAMVNAMSMRFFLPTPAVPSGHDQFFSTFSKFSEITWRITPELTVDMLNRYGAQSVQYAEFMLSFSTRDERAALTASIRGMTDHAAMLETLKQNGLDKLVAKARDEVADIERKVEALRDCPADPAKPACQVNYRFIVQVSRNTPIEDVFTQTAFAAALVRAEPRVVALNFVQTEDNQIARRDYTKHMEIVAVPGQRREGRAARRRAVDRAGAADRPHLPHPPGGRDRRRAPHRPRHRARLRARRRRPARRIAPAPGHHRDQPDQQRRHPAGARQGPSAGDLSGGRRAGGAVDRRSGRLAHRHDQRIFPRRARARPELSHAEVARPQRADLFVSVRRRQTAGAWRASTVRRREFEASIARQQPWPQRLWMLAAEAVAPVK